ncbi:TPA: hypothetical protein N0F65_002436 [Lagenidium giganteum]|uniref:Cilia- and flagella-associated protein 45 n=1 Tax=Lagenidium giganteum TaxID=4803 RepID=A0AAV2YQ95_9STRA|nr:TPA: hypothetical protein N0F65_002436 [Lagenidium giganteum]
MASHVVNRKDVRRRTGGMQRALRVALVGLATTAVLSLFLMASNRLTFRSGPAVHASEGFSEATRVAEDELRAEKHAEDTASRPNVSLALPEASKHSRIDIKPSTPTPSQPHVTTAAPSASLQSPKYALIRAIGNSLPPRHDPARALQNLRFILEHEQLEDPTVMKHWVFNRLLNATALQQLKALLDEFGASYTEIPFVLEEYAQQSYNVIVEDTREDGVHKDPDADPNEWTKMLTLNEIYDNKNRYALSINHARNKMLDIGIAHGARWILPWDQNCFMTREAWHQVKATIEDEEARNEADKDRVPIKYFFSYMDRLVEENDVIFSPEYKAQPWEEPQIIFRSDAVERFDEGLRYGKRDKAALLVRLRLPGVWDSWGWSTWELTRVQHNLSTDVQPGRAPTAGYAVRLYSGHADMEQGGHSSALFREIKRGEAVVNVLNSLEARVMNEIVHFDAAAPLLYNFTAVEEVQAALNAGKLSRKRKMQVDQIYADAKSALAIPDSSLWSVTHNAPVNFVESRNVFSNYVTHQGLDVNGDTDDPTLLKQMVYNTTALVLAWKLSGNEEYAHKAVKALNVWFLDEATHMLPDLDLTDMSVGKGNETNGLDDEGEVSGIRHTVGLLYTLDMLRLLYQGPESIVSASMKDRMKKWMDDLYIELHTARHSTKLFMPSPSLFGLQYDLQLAGLAAFLDDQVKFRFYVDTMRGRLASMLDRDGKLLIFGGVTTQSYKLQSLASWNLALDFANRLNLTSSFFRYDLNVYDGEESESDEGLICRMVSTQIPCCGKDEDAMVGKCTSLVQKLNDAQLSVYVAITRKAIPNCPSLQKKATCTSLAKTKLKRPVDDTLFGAKKKDTKGTRALQAGREIVGSASSNQEEHKIMMSATKRAGRKHQSSQKSLTVVGDADLDRMKKETKIMTAAELEELEGKREEEQERQRLSAKARKEHMMKLSEEAAKRAPKSEIELALEAEKRETLRRANALKDQQHDSVKLMKTLGARAQAFTIRDQQLKVREELEEETRVYDEKMNLLMEVDRLEGLKRQEVIDESKKEKRIADRKILEEQIVERKKQREKENELVAHEGAEMLVKIKQQQGEELEREKLRRKRAAQSMEEIKQFNEEALQRKLLLQRKIKEEEERVAAYQLKKDEENRMREEEEARKRHEAELRCAKLRSMQEKMANEKAELDELRAKRAAEARERQAREADLAIARKQKQEMDELRRAREAQALHRQRARIKEATMQQSEYESIMAQVEADKQRVRDEDEKKAVARMEHRRVLQQQIEDKERLKKETFAKKQEEGQALKAEYARELEKLERIRLDEVEELARAGVNPLYLAEMKALDIEKARNR